MPCQTVTVRPGSPEDDLQITDCWSRLDEWPASIDSITFWAEVTNNGDLDQDSGVVWALDGVDVRSASGSIGPGETETFFAEMDYDTAESIAGGPGLVSLSAQIPGKSPITCQDIVLLGNEDDPCDVIDCPPGTACENGECVQVDPCEGVTCGDCETCESGECVPTGGSCCGVSCGPCEICDGGDCVPVNDPCCGVTCGEGMVCENGECVPTDPGDPCENVSCGDCETCENGDCVPVDDACCGISCGECLVCENGTCVPVGDPCCGVSCPPGKVCDGGACVDDGGGDDGGLDTMTIVGLLALGIVALDSIWND